MTRVILIGVLIAVFTLGVVFGGGGTALSSFEECLESNGVQYDMMSVGSSSSVIVELAASNMSVNRAKAEVIKCYGLNVDSAPESIAVSFEDVDGERLSDEEFTLDREKYSDTDVRELANQSYNETVEEILGEN